MVCDKSRVMGRHGNGSKASKTGNAVEAGTQVKR